MMRSPHHHNQFSKHRSDNYLYPGRTFRRCDFKDVIKHILVTRIKKSDILVIFKNNTEAIGDINKSILPKHLHSEIKDIEDFHDTQIYSIKSV